MADELYVAFYPIALPGALVHPSLYGLAEPCVVVEHAQESAPATGAPILLVAVLGWFFVHFILLHRATSTATA